MNDNVDFGRQSRIYHFLASGLEHLKDGCHSGLSKPIKESHVVIEAFGAWEPLSEHVIAPTNKFPFKFNLPSTYSGNIVQ